MVADLKVNPFRLTDDFIKQYENITPDFGFNGLGEIVFRRTYSRIKSDGTNEAWFETVRRVVEGTYSMQKRWIMGQRLEWLHNKAQRSAQEMYDRIFTMKFLPPGRGLWAMGSALTEERGLHAATFNCSFVSTENILTDLAEPFTFLMDASMLGIGVGFDTKGADLLRVHGPVGEPTTFVIPDSREGWVESLERLLLSFFKPDQAPVEFDYSQIRPEGEPIKGFGGVASGYVPLKALHDHARVILGGLVDEHLTTTAIVDIMNLTGKCVVAGNVRRSALISFGDGSQEYLDLKNPQVNPERNHPQTG